MDCERSGRQPALPGVRTALKSVHTDAIYTCHVKPQVQWVVSGPDGNRPYLDSANFVTRSSKLVMNCGAWPPCTSEGSPTRPAIFVSAWASTLSPADIEVCYPSIDFPCKCEHNNPVMNCGAWPPCTSEGSATKPAIFISAWASTLSPVDIEVCYPSIDSPCEC